MQIWSRRRIETCLLAMLGIASVIPLRFFVEPTVGFSMEMASLLVAFAASVIGQSIGERSRATRHIKVTGLFALILSPILCAIAARWFFASPIAFEMSTLTVFGAIALAIAVVAPTGRVLSLSLITSGFLVLFCASISDDPYAIVYPIAWMLLCVWHLVANHWDRLDLAMPDSIHRSAYLRPSVLVLTLLVLATGAFVVKGRTPHTEKLLFGFMPTSGGSVWSDPAARNGVGSGDAAIAAKDHAEAFGAVDSDIFLESTESTLFDMANDMIGEPMKKSIWEKRQAMANANVIPMHERAAKSEQGGGTFATERMPPKEHRHLKDATVPAVVQWDGPTGIRLAMQRYDTFDGSDWSQSNRLRNQTITRHDIGESAWFFNAGLRKYVSREPDAVSVGLLKNIRLDSQRIPAPMMTAGIHIKEIKRQDFFGISEDGSFFMPGRQRLPPLTVVHLASLQIMEDEIRQRLVSQTDVQTPILQDGLDSINDMVRALVQPMTNERMLPAEQLSACVEKLRTNFTFIRDGDLAATSLPEFLRTGCGGDHLFATTAALLARELGLPSRLVTGFYVRPDAMDMAAGHASVLPEDVHFWAEVQLNDGRWIEIEPTPGYRQPLYRPSWWLITRRWAMASWPILVCGIVTLGGTYITRRIWIDWLLTISWFFSRCLSPRQRIRLACRIIETRARMAGQGRPAGTTQRAWLEQLTLADATISHAAIQFCDAADTLCFGNGEDCATSNAARLVGFLQIQTINQITQEPTS